MKYIKRHSTLCLILICAVAGIAVGLSAAVIQNQRGPEKPPMAEVAETEPVTIPAGTLPAAENREPDPLLILVNPWNTVPEDWEADLVDMENGQSVDRRCAADLWAMLDACKGMGRWPLVVSSYRTQEKQQALYDNKVQRVMAQGFGEEEALIEAARVVAFPGTSEHQLGLAVDIVDSENMNLDESQEQTATQRWLMEHSWEYGFILRYPKEKSSVTGIIYEPWHYRYVGREYAKEIFESGLCLEEYLELNA